MKVQLSILAAVAALALSGSAKADDLIFDRGLPTANLNNGAGANQSNVAWADEESSATPSDTYLVGDDFTLGGSGTYHVSDIRIWTVTDPSTNSMSLLGGLNGSATYGSISASPTVTDTTYAGGLDYETQSGTFDQIYQLDFAVNLNLTAGQTYNFFLDSSYQGSGSTYINAFLLASNAALSGSTQQGADGLYDFLDIGPGGVESVDPVDSAVDGWNKSSDINVQVYGTATPVPSSVKGSLALLGILGVAGLKRRTQATA